MNKIAFTMAFILFCGCSTALKRSKKVEIGWTEETVLSEVGAPEERLETWGSSYLVYKKKNLVCLVSLKANVVDKETQCVSPYEYMALRWVGKDEDSLISAFGPPSQTAELHDHTHWISFNEDSGYRSKSVSLTRGVATTKTNKLYCKTRFHVGRDNKITEYAFEGTNCY